MTHKINLKIGDKPDLRWVPIDLIDSDKAYQRDVVQHRVSQILREFSWEKFGALILAEQPSGRFHVYDGQHRHLAAKLHPSIDEVPAVVSTLAHTAEEAAAFLGVNTSRTAVGPVQKYWAGVMAGDADSLRVRSVLEKAGCAVAGEPGETGHNRTNAVSAVARAIKTYGDAAVVFACSALSEGWRSDQKAQKGTMITALARLHRSNEHISRERVLKVLGSHDRDALSGNAETLRRISGGDAPTAIAKTFCELYNKGLQKGQIFIGARS
ncbi:DUF6551 family protein [Roseibium alexandrii]|uniref:DUF6551 family protein n=1 Tax=Roseibium alexandrii TaxID=388408 RepID=UPI003752B672